MQYLCQYIRKFRLENHHVYIINHCILSSKRKIMSQNETSISQIETQYIIDMNNIKILIDKRY